MQIRLIGTHAEVQTAAAEIASLFTTVAASPPYPVHHRRCGRRTPIPGMTRIYLEVHP